MYRVFCESYHNYQSNYTTETNREYRAKIVEPMELLVDLDRYKHEMASNSTLYMHLGDLLAYMEQNIERYPKLKAFLWTLESRGIKGIKFGIVDNDELEEQTKIINMFLNLQYWEAKDH